MKSEAVQEYRTAVGKTCRLAAFVQVAHGVSPESVEAQIAASHSGGGPLHPVLRTLHSAVVQADNLERFLRELGMDAGELEGIAADASAPILAEWTYGKPLDPLPRRRRRFFR